MEGDEITELELSNDELVNVTLEIKYAQCFYRNVDLHSIDMDNVDLHLIDVDDVAPPTI